MYRQFTIDCNLLLHTTCKCPSKKCRKNPEALLKAYLETILASPSGLTKGTCAEKFGTAFFSGIRSSDDTLNSKCAILIIDSKTLIFDNALVDNDWIQKKKLANNRTLSIYAIDMRDSHVHGFFSAIPIKKIVHSMPLDDIIQCQRRLNNQKTIIVSTKGLLKISKSNDAMNVSVPDRILTFIACDMCNATSSILQDVKLDINKIKYTCSEFLESNLHSSGFSSDGEVNLEMFERAVPILSELDSMCVVSKHWIDEYKRIGDIRNVCRVVVIHVKCLCDISSRLTDVMNRTHALKAPRQRKPLYKVRTIEVVEETTFRKFTLSDTLWFFETMLEQFDLKSLANQLRQAISEGMYQMMSLLCWLGENSTVHDLREKIHRKLNTGDSFKRLTEKSLSTKYRRGYAFLESLLMQLGTRCPRCSDARFYEFDFLETKDSLIFEETTTRRSVPLGGGIFAMYLLPLPLSPSSFRKLIDSLNKLKRFSPFPWEDNVDSRMLYIRQELFETTRWKKYMTCLASGILSVPYVKSLSEGSFMTNLRCRVSLQMLMRDRERLPGCVKEAIRDVKPGSTHFGNEERVFVTRILADLFFTEEQFSEWLRMEGVNIRYIKEVVSKTKGIWSKIMKAKENSEFKLGTKEWCSSLMNPTRAMCPFYKTYGNKEAAHEACAAHMQQAMGYTNRRAYPAKHPVLFIQKMYK